jgi:hypothetical protein
MKRLRLFYNIKLFARNQGRSTLRKLIELLTSQLRMLLVHPSLKNHSGAFDMINSHFGFRLERETNDGEEEYHYKSISIALE